MLKETVRYCNPVYIQTVTSSVVTLKSLDDKLALQVTDNLDTSHSDC